MKGCEYLLPGASSPLPHHRFDMLDLNSSGSSGLLSTTLPLAKIDD